MVLVPNVQRRHAQRDIAKGKAAGSHPEEDLAPAVLGVEPHVGVVALLDPCRRKPRLRALQPAGHARREPARLPVLAGHHRHAHLPARVRIMLVYAPEASLAGGTRSLFAAALRFALHTDLLLADRVSCMNGACAFEGHLRGRLRVSAGPHDGCAVRDEQTLRAERIEKLPVVRDKQPDAVELRESCGYGALCHGVDVVGRLVHDEHVGGSPQGAGHLQAPLLPSGECAVTPGPVALDGKPAAKPYGQAVVGNREIFHIDWRFFRTLSAVGAEEGRCDGAGVGL